MIGQLRRQVRIYGAFVATLTKVMMAYSVWFWVELLGQVLAMIALVYFWRGVYANTASIGGMGAGPTVNYILLAQVVAPVVRFSLVLDFGRAVREGTVAIELLRPVDYQLRYYVEWSSYALLNLLRQGVPLLIIAAVLFGVHLPADPAVWGAFLVSLFLGNTVIFFFDWIFGSLAFYTTETWGLHTLREGVATFFSGAIIPLAMLPGWMQSAAAALPFGQALYAPVGILSGLLPLSQAPRIWLGQLAWLISLGLLSRIVFQVAARKVTVHGG